jgi:small subunit ribosomal protein S2
MREELTRYGRIARLIIQREGAARGEVFIKYQEKSDAAKCKAALACRIFAGATVRCDYAPDWALAVAIARSSPEEAAAVAAEAPAAAAETPAAVAEAPATVAEAPAAVAEAPAAAAAAEVVESPAAAPAPW